MSVHPLIDLQSLPSTRSLFEPRRVQMNVGAFVNNLGPTMFYAFIGTFASTFVVGGIVWQAGQMGLCYPLGMLAALTFGSLISATDPVTVLAVFQSLGVKVDLFSMVFGESVLNDAVAIVLSRTLLSFNKPGTEVNQESINAAVQSFCIIFGGSLLIGAFFGIASSLVFKAMDMRHHADLVFMQVMAADGRGWPRMAVDGRGWPWMAADGRGWPWMPLMAADGYGWPPWRPMATETDYSLLTAPTPPSCSAPSRSSSHGAPTT